MGSFSKEFCLDLSLQAECGCGLVGRDLRAGHTRGRAGAACGLSVDKMGFGPIRGLAGVESFLGLPG